MSLERPRQEFFVMCGAINLKGVGDNEKDMTPNEEAFYRWVEGLEDSSEDDRERSEIQIEMEF